MELGCYKAVAKNEDVPVDTIVRVYEIDDENDRVGYESYTDSYHLGYDDFVKAFEFLPDFDFEQGRLKQLEELLNTADELAKLEPNIQIDETKALPGDTIDTIGSALATIKKATPESLRKQMNAIRTQATKTRKKIEKKQEEVRAIVEQKLNTLSGQLRKYQKMADIADEAMLTINLYLGAHEGVHQIRDGESAAIDVPIALRQLVLYMDEECALAPELRDMDWKDIDAFDKWVVVPENLQLVLPEEKGIVAMKPRRKNKAYSDSPMINFEMNKPNHVTYLLMRNGDKVYRVWSDLELTNVLFPKEDIFDKYFRKRRYNHDTNRHEEEVLQPGSYEYSRAMESAQKEQRHFMRVFLYLQGLLDRTPIFKPYPIPYINLCDRDQYNKYLKFVADAEKLLSTGRPSFKDWLKETNSKLKVGDRICGIFGYKQGFGYKDRGDRVWPERAESPDSYVLYALEERVGSEVYKFKYERTEEIWVEDEWTSRPPKTKASCKVRTGDDFILNFDEAELEDMQYYVHSRIDRGDYINMVPLLQTAIKLKQAEIEEEAPFRQLLQAEYVRLYGLGFEEAEVVIDELVRWWKFKTKIHRALTSDDKKAYQMIVQRGRVYLKRNRMREQLKSQYDWIVKKLKGKDTLLIAHYDGWKFKVLKWKNEDNLFVDEELWTANIHKKTVRRTEVKEWQTIDRQYKLWKIIYAHERWGDWGTHISRRTVLSDSEVLELTEQACESIKATIKERNERRDKEECFIPLAVSRKGDYRNRWYLYVWAEEPKYNPDRLLSHSIEDAEVQSVVLSWKRTIDGVKFLSSYWWGHKESIESVLAMCDGELTNFERRHIRSSHTRFLKRWDDNIEKLRRAQAPVKEYERVRSSMLDRVGDIRNEIEQRALRVAEKERFQKYLKDGGEARQWGVYRKELKAIYVNLLGLVDPLEHLVESHIEVKGLTVAQVLKLAVQYKPKKSKARGWGRSEKKHTPTAKRLRD